MAATATIATAAVGAAAWALIDARSASDPTTIACHRDATSDSDIAVVTATGNDAVEACKRPWTDGTFSTAGAPPLVGCIPRGGGVAVVVPGDGPQVCDQLGLARLTEKDDEEADSIVTFQDRVTSRLLDTGSCLPPSLVRTIVQEELHASGLDDWAIEESGPFNDAAPCGSIAIDAPTRTITIEPLPRLSG